MGSGWAFWLEEGPSTFVVYVGTSDFEEATKQVLAETPQATLAAHNEIPESVVRFLHIEGGGLIRAHVMKGGGF